MPRRLAAVVAAAALLVGCQTGHRPTLGDGVSTTLLGGEARTPVGDAAVDTVLAQLERPAGQDFTARYRLLRRLGDVHADGLVVRQGDALSVTVGDVRFLSGPPPSTCTMSTGECVEGTVEQRISDTGVSTSFWAAGPARALRVAYSRRTAPAQPASQQVGGQTVQCVDIPLGLGTERYCATALGPLAVWNAGDKQVELVSISSTPDPAALAVPTPKPADASSVTTLTPATTHA